MLLVVLLAVGMTGRGGMAQWLAGVSRIGVLVPLSPEQNKQSVDDFRTGMRALGWIEGGNVSIEFRFANATLQWPRRMPPRLSRERSMSSSHSAGIPLGRPARPPRRFRSLWTQTTRLKRASLPVCRGRAAVTGMSDMYTEVAAKQLETLKEIAPRVGKVGFLFQAGNPRYAQRVMKELEPAAASLGVSLLPVGVDMEKDLLRRFDEMTAAGADGSLVLAEPRTDAMRDAIAALALRHHLPGVASFRHYADAGVLLSYGASLSAVHQREAYFVDRILRGTKPADLPVEQPPSFELVVNLKTAKALGLTIPPLLLARADEVIE
jgi:putative ABC transport system substrate-binding protein